MAGPGSGKLCSGVRQFCDSLLRDTMCQHGDSSSQGESLYLANGPLHGDKCTASRATMSAIDV